MIIDLILLILGILGLIIASITDIKKREVPDSLTFGLIIIGLLLRLIYAILYSTWTYFTLALLWLIIFYAFGAIMYYSKQWGGGDAKMLMALGVLYATPPTLINIKTDSIPFPITILFNIFIIGSIYGLAWTFTLIVKHRKKFKIEFIKSLKESKKIFKISLMIVILTLINLLIIDLKEIRILLIILGCLFLIYPYLYIAIKIVEKLSFYKTIPPSKLTEGDWLTKDIYKNKKLVYSAKNYGIDKKDIQKLIKLKIRSVTIKEGIPFIPSFLIGTLIALFIGNLLFIIT